MIEGAPFAIQALERWPDKVRVAEADDGVPGITIEGRRYPEPTGPGAGCPPANSLNTAEGIDPTTVDGMLADADREGIDRMVLYPSLGIAIPGFEDPVFAGEFAGLYNRYVGDWCRDSGGRLFGVGVVPIEDVERSVAMLSEIRDQGLVAAMLPPALRDRNLDHPDLDPFYAAAAEAGLPLAIHGAPGVHLPKIGVDRFDNYIQVHCISFPFDQMTAMTALVSGGVFERHPGLKVAFLEAGVGWVPYFIERMHEHFEKRGDWIERGWKRPPREYLERGQVWVSCEPEEAMLPAVVEELGDGFIMYASDYPHWDSEFPESSRPLRERSDIDEDTRSAILGTNATRFYGLP
ncbi:MAG: amidohydrolase family protein [Deltaproteobacteria bacterium]